MNEFTVEFKCAQCDKPQKVLVEWNQIVSINKKLGGSVTALVECPACGTEQKVTVDRSQVQ